MSAFELWRDRLHDLCIRIRVRTRDELRVGDAPSVARPIGRGVGDVTFGLDVPGEELIDDWLVTQAGREPLSVLTEDRGWRHMGPAAGGDPIELPGFDHGGPRIAFDPIDGTRNLMADLRPAWTVVSFAPAGTGEPRFADLTGGLVAEIPPTNAATARTLEAGVGGECMLETRALDGERRERRIVEVDADDRVEHGYFPFFRYVPDQRPELARLEAAFFERLARLEGADVRSCYDDQYISNAGQLVLLALGTYRMFVDARALIGRRAGVETVTSKPYDVGGALVCARAAGVALTAADGSELDFPIDASTAVDFAGYANDATRSRLEHHWLAVLEGE